MIKVVTVSFFISFFVFILTHLAIFHAGIVKRRFRGMLILALCGSILTVILLLSFVSWRGGALMKEYNKGLIIFHVVGIYAFLWYFYCHLIVIIDRSISVRMLVEIAESGKEGLTQEEIKQRYSLEEKFRDELRDMVFLNKIKEENGKLRNTPSGARHAKMVSFLREYLNLAQNR